MITLYGIEACGTVKKARAWLEERDVDVRFVDFRENPVNTAQVQRWVEALGAKALRNTSGKSYRALGDEKKTWSDDQWVTAFSADPMLIKRPVIERDGRPIQVGFRSGTVEGV